MYNKTLIETQHRHGTILSGLNELSEVDGFKSWREKEAKDLSELVQKRLHALQNPKDCSTAKKLICKLNKGKNDVLWSFSKNPSCTVSYTHLTLPTIYSV